MFTNHMKKRIRQLNTLAQEGQLHGSYEAGFGRKYDYLSTGRSVLRALAMQLGLVEWKVTVNPAGPAVSGEVILRGMWEPWSNHTFKGRGIELWFAEPQLIRINGIKGGAFFHRSINKMEHGISGSNRWSGFQELADDPDGWVVKLKRAYCDHEINEYYGHLKHGPEKPGYEDIVLGCLKCDYVFKAPRDLAPRLYRLLTDEELHGLAEHYLVIGEKYRDDSGLGGVFITKYTGQREDGLFHFNYLDPFSRELYPLGLSHTGNYVAHTMLLRLGQRPEKLGT